MNGLRSTVEQVELDLTSTGGLPGKYADMTEGKGSEDVYKGMPITVNHKI